MLAYRFNHQTVYRMLYSLVIINKLEYSFNHQTVYRMLSALIFIAVIVAIVSITKRCTECFLQSVKKLNNVWAVSITKRCTECFREDDFKIFSSKEFQSPNGVQNALDCEARRRQKKLFQSPNGVQNALALNDVFNKVDLFQSPNGVQNAFRSMPMS